MRNGPSSISAHKWFKSLEWASVYERKYEPEFKPQADAPFDASNFDDDYEDVPIRGVESDLTEAEQEQFSVF